jgi:hypothetical protein
LLEIIEQIQQASVQRLGQMAMQTVADVERQVVDTIGDFKALSQQSGDVISRFEKNMNNYFDELLDKEIIKEDAVFSFETLSLVQEEELDVMVALEGMVNASRNEHLAVFISFNTRLASLFPRKRIDESSNPLDPEQIATAFQEALRPLGLDAQNCLTIYRAFNADVLKHLDQVLNDANGILVEYNVIPDLGMEASKESASAPSTRNTPRVDPTSAFGMVEEETEDQREDNPELFSVMQNLLHSDEPRSPETGATDEPVQLVPGSDEPQVMVPASMVSALNKAASAMQPLEIREGQNVETIDQAKLMEVLTSIQEKLSTTPADTIPESIDEVEKLDISQSLGEMLQADSDDDTVSAVDRQSSDIINLVTLLYDAIWQDNSVPIPIKELIGRTQITIIKVALADVDFFNNENHPARTVLNEFAAAGIGWTEVESLEQDPLYQKISELVERILTDYQDNMSLFEELIRDFKDFKAKEAAKTRQLEQRILKASERNDRLDDIHELVTQKISERILGRDINSFVEEMLRGPFHKFMVMLVLKEGPGSSAWKQSINTIDVLLWSVQQHEQKDDRDRLATVNPRLINNLRKAFRIASIDKDEIDRLIDRLQKVQLESFDEEIAESVGPATDATADLETEAAKGSNESEVRFLRAGEDETPEEELPPPIESRPEEPVSDEPEISATYLDQVDSLVVGQWVEFAGADEETGTRCKLAAKITAIDKFIFVNRQGVKVVEKTRSGLAVELRDGTVKFITEGLLFSRALESVIGNLRESQHEQQTGSAYQPTQDESVSG